MLIIYSLRNAYTPFLWVFIKRLASVFGLHFFALLIDPKYRNQTQSNRLRLSLALSTFLSLWLSNGPGNRRKPLLIDFWGLSFWHLTDKLPRPGEARHWKHFRELSTCCNSIFDFCLAARQISVCGQLIEASKAGKQPMQIARKLTNLGFNKRIDSNLSKYVNVWLQVYKQAHSNGLHLPLTKANSFDLSANWSWPTAHVCKSLSIWH